ncbi:hypothetical protein B0H16DRAFT_1472622 [Mycena metata]|uniref:Uncharacterized protein n=1 Tax=Mycena metata TaxID=1033252 RepID=A0AAD7HMM7_9AGAR|nr:hypothetical protein B0H16DRAFT_1472622 [Mycena metata]
MTLLASRPLIAKIHCSANDVMAHQWRCIVRITIVRTVWNCGLFTTTHLESRHTLGPLPEGDGIADVSSEIRYEEQWENSLKRELRPQGEQAGGRRRGKAAGDLGVVCFTHIERYKVAQLRPPPPGGAAAEGEGLIPRSFYLCRPEMWGDGSKGANPGVKKG